MVEYIQLQGLRLIGVLDLLVKYKRWSKYFDLYTPVCLAQVDLGLAYT